MKRYYLFLILALTTCIGFASTVTDSRNDRLSFLFGKLNTRKQIAKSIESEVEQKSNKISLESGKIAYGYCTGDYSWSHDYEHSGLYSFDITSPESLKQEFENNLKVLAGTYYNGFIYAEIAVLTEDGLGVISLDFCKMDVKTGECTVIADWLPLAPVCYDMTYDYSSNTLLGILQISETSSRLYHIDINTGKLTPIGSTTIPRAFVGLACSSDGTVYAIDSDGNLVTIDKKGKALTIGNTGEVLELGGNGGFYFQSMEFNHYDEKLYWAAIDNKMKSKFGMVSLATGKFTSNGTLGNNASIAALYFPFDGVGVESAGEIQFDIYPNPASETININGDFTDVSIYNSMGQCVGTYPGETTKIDVNNLPEGVYVIKATNGNVHSTRKIIVRK